MRKSRKSLEKLIVNQNRNEKIKTEFMENPVVMLNVKEIQIQNIDHLGIVAGMVDAIGLVEIINDLIGEEKGEKVSPGHAVKAMILNGLGFVSQPLYMFPKFFETIACEHLIGAGVKPEYLNDDKLGRVMDKLFIKGLDTIFLVIALNAAGSNLADSEFVESELSGYSFKENQITYGDIEQRWLVVQSQVRKESDLRKLSQKIIKAEEKAVKELKKLSQDKFACEADAIKALLKISKQFKYHQIEQSNVSEITSKKKDNQPEKFYQIFGTVSRNENQINKEVQSAGRFVIATNILESSVLSNDSMLKEYKAQQSCERGFGFLKDPLFFADSIFLKSPERIESLAMIMGLCLLVYTLAQRQIRAALRENQSTIRNQLGKPTAKPTVRWIFQCFQSIHLVTSNDQIQISNQNKDRDFILRLLPSDCLHYYKFVT
ncbi:Transposase [Nodularia spumigena CCY9414]|jgi:transposase|nr:Transposase [Nodularia spumigena CCY9414]AHJ28001.1 Transposase [Nodularia spumigena CCY9414]EAW45698.1 hypothetical protein N9414_12628 [Nodularia spumigena CCY9414]EAW47135.1 hypothetical protein N9414_04760 [Nodularia spumigena CCY9414]